MTIGPVGDSGISKKALDIAAQQASEINQLRSDLTQTTDTGDKFIMGELLMQPAAFTSLMGSVAANTKSPVESLIANYALFQMKNGSSSQVDIEATMNAITDPTSQNLSSLVGQLANIPTPNMGAAAKQMMIDNMLTRIDRGVAVSTADIQRLFGTLTSGYAGGNIPSLDLAQAQSQTVENVASAMPTNLNATTEPSTILQIFDNINAGSTPATQPAQTAATPTNQPAATQMIQANAQAQQANKAVTSDIIQLFSLYPPSGVPSKPNNALINKLYTDVDNYLKYCGYTEQQKTSIREAVQNMAIRPISYKDVYNITAMIFNSSQTAVQLAAQAKATTAKAVTAGTVITANPANAGTLGNLFDRLFRRR